jgi:DNA-binding NarL/FixJ family response regulator
MLRPDVVLMDARMPGGDGIAATKELAGPGVADPLNVLVMTTFDEDEYIFGALENRAAGFVLKNASADELHQAVLDVARGIGVLAPAVVRRVLDEFSQRSTPQPDVEAVPYVEAAPSVESRLSPLTEREAEVAFGVLRGLTNSEIGIELHLAPSTVKWHLERIRVKTGARSRVAIADWVRSNSSPSN